MWRHYPWLIGLLLAPLLFGSVNPEGQAVVGIFFSLSFLLLAGEFGPRGGRSRVSWWKWIAIGLLSLPLLPMPIGVVEWISPQRAELAKMFPVEPGGTAGWVTLTVSVANTVQRLWELMLLIAAFCLARHASRHPAFPRLFVGFVSFALLLLAASDV